MKAFLGENYDQIMSLRSQKDAGLGKAVCPDVKWHMTVYLELFWSVVHTEIPGMYVLIFCLSAAF